MNDIKFEQKRSLTRLEAADQLTALAAVLREGGDAELEFGTGTVSLRVPDELRGELEIEMDEGWVELEIEFRWPVASSRTAPSPAVATGTEKPARRKAAPSKPDRGGTGASGSRSVKRSAAKKA
ncbi:amphi-Trp domain-containing protein [Streptomyces sp. NPDC002039]|uniref:amphi-Trp domain-containing protein n=1 Tax=unclassified Streptomyces TaxID=2593676 RepID=UPI0033285EAA